MKAIIDFLQKASPLLLGRGRGWGFLLLLLLSSCNYYHDDGWESYFQTIGVEVSGGSSGEDGSSPFDGAFGEGFQYETKHSSLYWGDEGKEVNTHYRPYSVGNATRYYRGSGEDEE